jgi:hypothetical protein
MQANSPKGIPRHLQINKDRAVVGVPMQTGFQGAFVSIIHHQQGLSRRRGL